MYQGKFANKNKSRGQNVNVENEETSFPSQNQNTENEWRPRFPEQKAASETARDPQKEKAVKSNMPQSDRSPRTKAAPQPERSVRPQTSRADRTVRTQMSQQSRRPAPADPRLQFDVKFDAPSRPLQMEQLPDYEEDFNQPQVVVKKKRAGAIVGGILFYIILILAIGVFMVNLHGRMNVMTEQLSAYEEKQPNYVSQQVFAEIFGAPDWSAIFDNTSVEISKFEGKAAFVKFMEEKVGDTHLTYHKIASEDESRIQYMILLDREEIACFYMVNKSENADAPDWRMDGIEVYFEAENTYRINSTTDHVVKINGIAVDDSYLIQKTGKNFVEDLGELSSNVKIPGACVYEVSNFLTKPEVTIEDASGKQLTVSYDEETATFSEPAADQQIPGEAKKLALDAVETYCKYMIKKVYQGELSKFFKPGTDTSRAITMSDLTWIQKESGHGFADEKVSDYVRLDEKTFSIRVSLTWQLTRKDNSIKESPVDVTLLFEQEPNEKWRCVRMTGVEFVEPFNTVRVRFMHEDNIIASMMVDSEDKTIKCPAVGVPEGRELAGWVTVMQDEEGNDYYQRVLEPDASGVANVPDGLFDKPVDLYPVHVKAE